MALKPGLQGVSRYSTVSWVECVRLSECLNTLLLSVCTCGVCFSFNDSSLMWRIEGIFRCLICKRVLILKKKKGKKCTINSRKCDIFGLFVKTMKSQGLPFNLLCDDSFAKAPCVQHSLSVPCDWLVTSPEFFCPKSAGLDIFHHPTPLNRRLEKMDELAMEIWLQM